MMRVQKIGRLQIPSKYLAAYDIKEGDIIDIYQIEKVARRLESRK